MQRFLIGPSIGGAKLTKAAVEYIIRYERGLHRSITFEMAIDVNNHDEKFENVYANYTDSNEGRYVYEPLYTEWWRIYRHYHENVKFEDVPSDAMIDLPTMGVSEIRDLIMMYLVKSPYGSTISKELASELDKLNNGYELRIVEVPDGYQCIIMDDQEYGTEAVHECTKMWNADQDNDGFSKQQIKEFAYYESQSNGKSVFPDTIIVNGATTVGDPIVYKDLIIAKKGDRAVVYSKLNGKLAFLKRNKYYCETAGHPIEWFEIVGDELNKFQLHQIFHDFETIHEYYSLIQAVAPYAHEFQAEKKTDESGNS